MTRSEFDYQVRELKNKKGTAIREIAALQSEIKEEIASKHRQNNEIGELYDLDKHDWNNGDAED
jgi:hypothetical protein